MQFKIYQLRKQATTKAILFFLGLGSLIWFLIRVIPKPSRAGYPCMKVAMPLASSFVTFLLGISSFTLLFKKAREQFIQSKLSLAVSFAFLGLVAGTIVILSTQGKSIAADYQGPQAGNEPMGVAKGVNPGRVAWIHNPDATNELYGGGLEDEWYLDDNTNQDVVNEMLSEGLYFLTGKENDTLAWDALFRYFNNAHGNGDKGYTANEKIVIKINMNSYYYGISGGINTSPQLTYALLNQLINVVGAAGSDISIGDPNCPLISNTYEKCITDFPDVNYWRANGASIPEGTPDDIVIYSDGSQTDKLPQAYIDATYMINMPVFKKHHRAGISITSKNHFGSIAPYASGASHLHYALPVPEANYFWDPDNQNDEYGKYRCLVDLMGHEQLGGKTVLYLVDGIWGSTNWGHPPIKWEMAPFNNDWPSSLFLSQDPVAIQSVCYDFLYEEFDENHPTEGGEADMEIGPYPHFNATDDFLHQAADPSLWPGNISYDPENDGSVLTSLGTHEHWNNATDKKYSRNLNSGNGIELVGTYETTGISEQEIIADGYELFPNYPNPFSESTTLGFHLASPSYAILTIYNNAGVLLKQVNYAEKMVGNYEYTWYCADISPGQYIYTLDIANEKGNFSLSGRLLKMK